MKVRSRQELVNYVNYGNVVEYLFFWGHKKPSKGVSKSCFSQWYEASFTVGKNQYMTAEHFMMNQKALLFNDQEAAKKLLKAENPGAAKAIGREVRGFDQRVWEQHRFKIVVEGNLAKFKAHEALKNFLLGTGDQVLVEASPVDQIWGIGLDEHHPDRFNPNNWKGENLLGFALMEARERLL